MCNSMETFVLFLQFSNYVSKHQEPHGMSLTADDHDDCGTRLFLMVGSGGRVFDLRLKKPIEWH